MKNIKVLMIALVLLLVAGCTKTNEANELKIVTSFFPVQSLTQALVGQDVRVIVEGGDAHHFEPTPKERVAMAEADLFLYHGAGFEFWFEPSMVTKGLSVEVSKGVDLLEDLDHDGHGHGGVDPHTWLDPNNAAIMLDNIYQALVELDPSGQELYKTNYDKVSKELNEIISDYKQLLEVKNHHMVVDHHAYGYLEKGYNLHQEAIIEGVATGDVSFKQTERAIEEIKELGVKAIFVDPSYRNDIIDTIQAATEVDVFNLYTLEQKVDDRSYLDMLKANYESLYKGLGSND